MQRAFSSGRAPIANASSAPHRAATASTPARSHGDRERFEREAVPQLDFLYRVAIRLAREPSLAEDLVQETMLKALRAWHQFEPGTNVRAWLARILRNAFVSDYRRTTRAPEPLSLEVLDALAASGAEDDPETAFFDRLVDDEVVAAIDALPLAYREPLVLSDVEDLKYSEIAAIMDLPLGTVKSRIFRARRLLRDRLHAYAVEAGYVPAPAAGASHWRACSVSGVHQPTPPEEVYHAPQR